jgi:hypothetical protein
MVAVVRPTTSKVVTPKSKGTVSARTEQKHIVSKLPLEMTLTVTAFKFRPPEKPAPDRHERGEEIFISQPVKSSTRSGLSGFYCFKIGAEKCLDVLSSTTGTYLLTFSLVSSCKNSHTKQQTQIQLCGLIMCISNSTASFGSLIRVGEDCHIKLQVWG